MEILFTFVPKEEMQQSITAEFPDADFHFIYKDKSKLPTADILVTYGEDLDEGDIDKTRNLKWIMVVSAGVEKMPHKAIAERGIAVSNVRGIHKTPMGESVLGHLLALKRSLPDIYENQRKHKWERKFRSSELFGSTALILGPGAIGSEIGRLLQAFGVKTIGCNRSGKQAEFMDEMITFDNLYAELPEANIIISVLPSTSDTKYLLNLEHFKAMKKDAIFMNFGRGDLVKEETLIEAMKTEMIGYAVLDVFEKEPLPEDHPFWKMENIIISPHVSGKSEKYLERAMEVFLPNLRKWLDGDREPTNPVNMEKGY
ncbi:D-2-hydroxyacid dehydrogenase [Planococcus salinarum]|uniref:D-2-hydroxyacid dehydrogenase n=1 Tax=Planococcus salinarum TaxID=622695 RepID=UPI000E3DD65E|nr:D-2-hydroxyacid dehydrogenase [Planococcus salinarum]TAA71805.1 D-2-hydroxyacid dehydrogenase [Planococcus salinarum]